MKKNLNKNLENTLTSIITDIIVSSFAAVVLFTTGIGLWEVGSALYLSVSKTTMTSLLQALAPFTLGSVFTITMLLLLAISTQNVGDVTHANVTDVTAATELLKFKSLLQYCNIDIYQKCISQELHPEMSVNEITLLREECLVKCITK